MNNKRFGVFKWQGQGAYRPEDAMKSYKSESAARKYADKLNEAITNYPVNRGYVVRTYNLGA